MNSNTSAIRRKDLQVELHETQKLLHKKGNSHWMEETAYKIGDNLCQPYI
jgi:hypothetical protein